ncbi:coiled-coil domain-containing protein 87-like [Haliotis rufescens]|uniref:coiled-coil domain-containing protein 87-like n=1 Tax=Haliotis rufescens TaxID=6454 RepID=UPI00201FB261|nr:coiled-coil domain-containing protein 87-like [Haliotis rufescens]XP_048258487.1 coiled-coil domain-containing protein 87-like [Haliotis rufescens]
MSTEAKNTSSFQGFMRESKIRTPKYQPVRVVKPEKHDAMYPMRWPPYDNNDVENRIDGVLGPLSIFAPFPHEDEPEHVELELERPVTPIDKEIKSQPSSLDQLTKFVRRRIAARPDVPFLSIEDQQNLAGIIMGEVNLIWPDIRKQIDDPFLSPEENKELNRRIAVYIVTVCEQLFSHYLDKAQVLNSRGVFSGPANMSRLKAQLALEASKFLTILTIRRYIVADMRGQGETDSAASEDFFPSHPTKAKPAVGGFAQLSYEGLIQTSRPKSKVKKYRMRTLDHDVREMTNNMPSLDTSKLMDLVAQLPDRAMASASEDARSLASRISERESKTSCFLKEEASLQKVLLKRCRSDPNLHDGETLLEEMEISERVRDDPFDHYELDVLHREREIMAKEKVSDDQPKMGSREYAAEDLRRLVDRKDESNQEVDEDLPPLLQAIIRNARHDGLKEKMEEELKELEKKKQQRIEDEHIAVEEPTHPQPATVSSKLSNQLTVRTSDVRVSERVCMSSITLNRFATVYNDLIEEVDPATVKGLDKNLFLSDEIREVYREIMKTVPQDHLELDDDPMIISAAENISLAGAMASTTLAKKPNERVINPQLRKGHDPPWGEMDASNWARTPSSPPKNLQGDNTFTPLTPNPEKIHAAFSNHPSKSSQPLTSSENMPSVVADKMARTYASWLQWWKSTVTSDDYMKFLSTQETDFMGVLFHFYDSEDDDEDDDESESGGGTGRGPSIGIGNRGRLPKRNNTRSSHSSKALEQRERDRKVEELKALKTEYKEGFWNVNSVLLGGLGKDPGLEVDEEEASKKTQQPVEAEKSAKTLKERVAQARQARLMLEKSRAKSQASGRQTSTTHSAASKSSEAEFKKPATPQERLERVWACLKMTDSMKLDMAIKYSCNEFFARLDEVMEKWESAADLILKREALMEKLENFERRASDPNRFFEKGHKGSSVLRLEEARQRSFYYKSIDALDLEIKAELDYVKEKFQDSISFKGRPYAEKMKWDRVEMLYWLQEERKQHAIQYETLTRQLPLKHAQLEPLQLQAK